MLCVKCGAQNVDDASHCVKCGAVLPQIGSQQETSDEPEYVNERLQELEEAASKAAEGEWTPERFGQYLEEVAATLAEREQAIREIEIPPEALEDFREELEVGFQGIQLYNEGVARMMMFVEDEDVTHLEEGIELVRQGNEHINEAMRINRENRRRLEEIYRDTSPMM